MHAKLLPRLRGDLLVAALLLVWKLTCVTAFTCLAGVLKVNRDAAACTRKLSAGQATTATSSCSSSSSSADALIDAIDRMDLSMDDDVRRIFHGRGGCYPGYEHLTLDWYPPVLLFTSFQNITDDELQNWSGAMKRRWVECFSTEECDPISQASQDMHTSGMNLVYQCRANTPTTTHLLSGTVPEGQHIVQENGDKYLVHLLRGQNHGLFLDMANGRTWVRNSAKGKRVLNLFAYTCAFSVSALNGGADEAVNCDMAKGAIKVGQRNHELNGLQSARFLSHNVMKSWGKLKKLGPYDVVVVDPPSYQKGSFEAKKDYGKIIRRLPTLLRPGGRAMLCLNAPELDTHFLKSLVEMNAPELQFVERLKNPDTFPALDEDRALKVLLYELPEI